MVATISEMFKIGGRPSAKTVFSTLFLFTQLCRKLVIFVLGSLLFM